MITPVTALIGFLATVPGAVAVSINLCTEDTCGDCPSSLLVTEPTDGRPCIVYARDDIIAGNDFPPPSGGVQDAWINATPDAGTGLIVRSPADTGAEYCGVSVGTVNSPDTCGQLALQETLTFVTCHGVQDCNAKGLPGGPYSPPSSRFIVRDDKEMASGQSLVTAVRRADGSIVLPLAATLDGKDFMDGFAALFNATEQLAESRKAKRTSVDASPSLIDRATQVPPGGDPPPPMDPKNTSGGGDQSCTNFIVDNPDGYVRAALDTITTGFNVQATSEGATIMNSYASTTSWSQSFTAGIALDIFMASVTFEVSESQSETSGFSINVPPDQSGYIGWTPYFICASGSADCPGGNERGEACTPYNFNGGQPAGEYTFVQNFT